MKLGMRCTNKILKKNITFQILGGVYPWECTKVKVEYWKTNWVGLKRSLAGFSINSPIILVILVLEIVLLFIRQSTLLKMVL